MCWLVRQTSGHVCKKLLDWVEVGRPTLIVDGIIPCRLLDSLLLLPGWIQGDACLTFLLLFLPAVIDCSPKCAEK